jgi:hypothetical protein
MLQRISCSGEPFAPITKSMPLVLSEILSSNCLLNNSRIVITAIPNESNKILITVFSGFAFK